MFAKYWYVWTGAAIVAVAASALELARHPYTPQTSKDTSCHNPFRHTTATVIAPKLNIDLDIPERDWPKLTALFEKFAQDRGWSFRNANVQIPGEVNAINLDICTPSSLRILVAWNHWRGTHAFDRAPGRGLPIGLYGNVPTRRWQRVARDFVEALDEQWPGHVRFENRDGYFETRPNYLE